MHFVIFRLSEACTVVEGLLSGQSPLYDKQRQRSTAMNVRQQLYDTACIIAIDKHPAVCNLSLHRG